MDLKPNDVVRFTSNTDERYNGPFLIVTITHTRIDVRKPPDEHYTLSIKDGVIEEVDEVVLLHSAHHSGYAEIHGLLPNKKIVISFADQTDQVYGIIEALEHDMITVKTEDGTILYIDFEYTGPPSSITLITVDDGIIDVEYEENDYILPESKSRFTIERQVNDLMDHLLVNEKQTIRSIQKANVITQRFKEVRTLFSTPELDPFVHTSTPTIYNTPWIIPSTKQLNRKVFMYDSNTTRYIEELIEIQKKSDPYSVVYKRVLEEMQPFHNAPQGEKITETIISLIASGSVAKVDEDGDTIVKKAEWIPQVLTKPYAINVNTSPEVVAFNSYIVFPNMIEYSQCISPVLPLIKKVKFHGVAPHASIRNLDETGVETHDTIHACVPDIKSVIDMIYPIYSIQQCLEQTGPFLLYKNNLRPLHAKQLHQKIKRAISDYKPQASVSPYVPNALSDKQKQMSPTEWQVSLLHSDNGKLYATNESLTYEIDTRHTLDKHIEDSVDKTKSISPPVAKIYKTLVELKSDNDKNPIFYDPELDLTHYDEMGAYTTLKEMMNYLVKVKRVSPRTAGLYAPHYLNGKKRIIDGDYAKLKDSYYKRVNNNWKLDETCSGPYPCTTNEPDCETDTSCMKNEDVSFRLKQNAMQSILNAYHLHSYTEKADREAFLMHHREKMAYQLNRHKYLVKRMKSKYTDMFKKTAIVSTITSPYYTLLHFILQQPHKERHTELKQFIRLHTRIANKKDENPKWFYCIETDTKLLPFVFQTLIHAYETNTYANALRELEKNGDLRIDNSLLVTNEGGFLIHSVESTGAFEDVMRSTEIEDLFLDLPRDIHPNTQLVVELLSEASTLAKTSITKYFNYMIHEILKEPNLIIQSVAFVLKVANIVHHLNIDDYIPIMLTRQERFNSIVKRFKGVEEEPMTTKNIHYEIQTVSTKYGVQLMGKKNARLKVTRAFLWETFMPPSNIKHSKSQSPSINIMYDLQERIKSVKPLSDMISRTNTWQGEFIDARIHALLDSIPTPIRFKYEVDKPFIHVRTVPPVKHDFAVVGQQMMEVSEHVLPTEEEDYQLKIPLIKRELMGVLPLNTIKPSMPMIYLKTFIQTIARIIPSYLLHEAHTFSQIPLSLSKVLSGQHEQKLDTLLKAGYFNELRYKFNEPGSLNVDLILKDDEISAIITTINTRPCTDRYQYEYYIYFILKKYLDFGDDKIRTKTLLQMILQFFVKEYDKCFLTYEDIQRKTLKDKTSESNKKRILINGMESDKRYVSLFMEEHNLDKKAQLGRLRNYTKERYDAGEFKDTEGIAMDTGDLDFGDDGYDNNEDDGEEYD